MGLIVRPFRPEDFEELYRIDRAAFAPELAYSRAELHWYVLTRRSRTLVAEAAGGGAAGGPAGFVIGRCTRPGWGTVITLDVAPAWQRHGVGSLLLAAIERWLQGEGVRAVSLETPADESGALPFYLRQGYRQEGRVRGYYHGSLDAWSLVKRLPDGGPEP